MNTANKPWWERFTRNKTSAPTPGAEVSSIPPAEASSGGETTPQEDAFDEVLMPPGATDDTPDAENADGKNKEAGASSEPTATVNTAPTDQTTTNQSPIGQEGNEPTSGQKGTTNVEITAEQQALLTACETAGIKTAADVTTLKAQATAGEQALTDARAEAKTAATAAFGAKQPDKLAAAESLVAATNDLATLKMLAATWHNSAPGSDRPRDGSGNTLRQTRPNGAEAREAAREAGAEANGPKDDGARPRNGGGSGSRGNSFDKYNQVNAGQAR